MTESVQKKTKPLWILIAILFISVAADIGTKQWAINALMKPAFGKNTDNFPVCGNLDEERKREHFLSRLRINMTVVDNFWKFKYVENCASAFGMMQKVPEYLRFPFFIFVSILAFFFIPYLYIKTPSNQSLMLFSLPFILGGALGNLFDRVYYRYVIDFIDWYVVIDNRPYHWPTFNIADAVIVIGIGLMILQMFFEKKPASAN